MSKQPPIAMRAWIFCNRRGTKDKLTHPDANYCHLSAGITHADLQKGHWSKLDCCSAKCGEVKTTINHDEGVNSLCRAWHQRQTYALRCELLPSLTRNNSRKLAYKTLIEDWSLFSLMGRCQNNHQSWWGHEYCVMDVAPKTSLRAQMRIIAIFDKK
jgi:hypothetical protein